MLLSKRLKKFVFIKLHWGVSLDQPAPGPIEIGCPKAGGILDPFEVPWSSYNMNISLVV